MGDKKDDVRSLYMSYRIEGAYSPYKYIQIDIEGNGRGTVQYELYQEYVRENEEKEGMIAFEVDKVTIRNLMDSYEKADFFNIEVVDLNKDEVTVTDVGTTTLKYSYAGRERTLSYGYVEDSLLKELVGLYWQLVREKLPR